MKDDKMKKDSMVNVPRLLWKLHGKQSYPLDLILTYGFALIVMLFNLAFSSHLPLWKMIVVAMLSIDIGGGVISNFTRATIMYYRESKASPHSFVWFHVFQFLLLILVYRESYIAICVTALLTMLFSSIVLVLYKTKFQTQVCVFLFAILFLVMNLYKDLPLTLYLLLFFMSFKLLLGFANHWKMDNQ